MTPRRADENGAPSSLLPARCAVSNMKRASQAEVVRQTKGNKKTLTVACAAKHLKYISLDYKGTTCWHFNLICQAPITAEIR